MKKLLSILAVLIFISTGFADTTYVSGTIVNQTWTPAGSPYCVTGDILIAGLVIDPGVNVIFLGDYVFEVAGVLTAIGTADDEILFTSIDTITGWKGILFQNSVPGSEMSWCKVEWANSSGIRIIESFPALKNCRLINNSTLGNGGGLKINLTLPGVLEMEDCNISDNKTITNYTISPSNGGGIWVSSTLATVNFINCNIKNNRAERYDGHVWGGGVYINGNASFVRCLISNNSVYGADQIPGGNSAGRGGGVYIEQGNVSVMNSEIKTNSAIGTAPGGMSGNQGYASGGGIHVENGQINISNTIFNNNFASSSHGTQGGGLYANVGQINIDNSTLAYSNVHALYNSTSTMTIINSIVYFNNSGSVQINGIVSVSFCDVQGGYTGTGNINFNPVFQSIDSLIIVPGSLCIDAGDPNPIYNDVCFPPSLGTERNDMGAHGGPGACGWIEPITDIEDEIIGNATQYYLEQNYPNPFNPSTKISWQLPVGNQATLKVYDIMGREVATLVNEYKPAGGYEVEFNAISLPSGVYFYRLQAGSFTDTKKFILVK